MTTTAITKRKPETNTGAHDKEPTSKRSTPSTADTEQNKHMLAQAPVRRDSDTNTKAQLSPLAYALRTFSEASTATQRGCRTASSLLRRFRKLPLPTNTRFAFAEETLCEYSVRCTGGLCTDAPKQRRACSRNMHDWVHPSSLALRQRGAQPASHSFSVRTLHRRHP
jgi:hypothetical protein